MTTDINIGKRIRDQRMRQGLQQAELARQAGISASYLNLIEHDRRKIGGATLNKLADSLDVSPSYLIGGVSESLIAGLAEIAASDIASGDEMLRMEELAAEFPGWTEALIRLFQRNQRLEQRVQDLSDRVANDPELAQSVHDLLSHITSIRSTASILASSQNLEPEWQHRFHRNIDEDSRRLADSSAALMRYLETNPDGDVQTPQDELQAFFEARDYAVPEIETGPEIIDRLLTAEASRFSRQGQSIIRRALQWLADDARMLPMNKVTGYVTAHGLDPFAMAQSFAMPLPLVLRRLSALPEQIAGKIGLIICDASGALVYRKPAPGFSIPRTGSSCALWPLFQGLGAPMVPLRIRLRQSGRDETTVLAITATELNPPRTQADAGFAHPHMLLLPDRHSHAGDPLRVVGADCRICPMKSCAARREPSILAQSF